MSQKSKLTDQELGEIRDTVAATVQKLRGAELSPLLGFALSGLHGAEEAIAGEVKNRATAPATPAAKVA